MSIVITPVLIFLIFAFAIMLGRILGRNRNPVCAMAVGGCFLVFLSVCIMVSMHCLEITITTPHLLMIYAPILSMTFIVHRVSCRQMPWDITPEFTKLLLPSFIFFALIIMPYTHFTGVYVYAWQNFATAIRVEQNISWLVHPLSLWGFTAHSYPSVQPILLATIQIIGNLGVDAGFAVLSIFIAALGCATAYFFGLRAFRKPQTAAIFALLYIFTPVFTRYSHWATGRGLFLALFPLLLATMIPSDSEIGDHPEGLKNSRSIFLAFQHFGISAFQTFALLLLLALSHKVGFVFSLMYFPIYLFGFLMPKNSRRSAIIISLIPFVTLAFFVVPRTMLPFPVGNAIGIIRYSLTRLGLLMPLAIIGLVVPDNLLGTIKWRRLFPLVLVSIPLVFELNMYGALIATALITLAATEAIIWLLEYASSKAKECSGEVVAPPRSTGENSLFRIPKLLALSYFLLALCPLFAVATVIHRSRIAMPDSVYDATQFLEQRDPLGPFVVTAPGRIRTQMQAYLTGFPRFNVFAGTNLSMRVSPPPSIKDHPRKVLQHWIAYMRGFITVPETSTDWYGKNPRQYYVIIDGKGTHPPNSKQIYNKNGVQIYLADIISAKE